MRRVLLTAPILLALLPATVGAAPRAQTSTAPPPLAAKLTACDTGPNAADRSAGLEGSMPAIDGAVGLSMRFELQVKRGAARFKALPAPTFGKWIAAADGAAGFVYDKRVENLEAPAVYRVLVRYRWKDDGGRVVKTAQRLSAVCKQPDVRPDLRIDGLDVAPADAQGQSVYTVRVLNAGKGEAAMPFGVTLDVGDAPTLTQTLPSLGSLVTGEVRFTAPSCGGATMIRVAVDPDGTVDETDETDNAVARRCGPAAARTA